VDPPPPHTAGVHGENPDPVPGPEGQPLPVIGTGVVVTQGHAHHSVLHITVAREAWLGAPHTLPCVPQLAGAHFFHMEVCVEDGPATLFDVEAASSGKVEAQA